MNKLFLCYGCCVCLCYIRKLNQIKLNVNAIGIKFHGEKLFLNISVAQKTPNNNHDNYNMA